MPPLIPRLLTISIPESPVTSSAIVVQQETFLLPVDPVLAVAALETELGTILPTVQRHAPYLLADVGAAGVPDDLNT